MRVDHKAKERVTTEVLIAFSVLAYPGDANLVGGESDEYVELRQELKGLRWQDVPDSLIRRETSCLSFLSPLAFRYYLPAYLMYSVRNIENPDSGCMNTLASLRVAGPCPARIRRFTKLQRIAVKHFIEFFRDSAPEDAEEAEEVFSSYWCRVRG